MSAKKLYELVNKVLVEGAEPVQEASLDFPAMKKKLKKPSEKALESDGYAPRAGGERRFMAKHLDNIVKHEDPAGNGDDVYRASNIKAIDREAENHGYNPGDDEDIYEEANYGRHIRDMHVSNSKGGVRVYYNHNYNQYSLVPYKKVGGKEKGYGEMSVGFADDKSDAEGTARDMQKRLHGSIDEEFNLDKHKAKWISANTGPRKHVKAWLENPKNKKDPYRKSVLGGYAARKDHPNKKDIFAEDVENLKLALQDAIDLCMEQPSLDLLDLVEEGIGVFNVINEGIDIGMEPEEIVESIEEGKPFTIVFDDGDTYDVSEEDAKLFSGIYESLDEDNQILFIENLLGSKETFEEVRDFAINSALGLE